MLVLAGMIAIDANTPKPVNWLPAFGIDGKYPYGLYILDKELPALLNDSVQKFTVTPYEYLDPLYNYDSLVRAYTVSGTLLSIRPQADDDFESAKEMLYFAEHGNTVFLSMERFPQKLLDTLKIKLGADMKSLKDARQWLSNDNENSIYELQHGISPNYFSAIDSSSTEILGYQSGDSTRANFIRVKCKTGQIFLHTQPVAFTNFHLLKNNHHQYAEKLLSFIPRGTIFWALRGQAGALESNSPLRYVNSQPALKAAWYLFLFGGLLFLIFNAKRRQRIVPVIRPLENTTVDFARTIGNLYLQEGDHSNLVEKKIVYFLEKVRQDYLMDTSVLDDQFVNRLHHKTGKDLMDIQRLVYLIKQHRKNLFDSVESDVIEINTAIEKVLN